LAKGPFGTLGAVACALRACKTLPTERGCVYAPAAVSPATSYLVQTLVTLVGVCALAALVLYGARRAGLGRPSGPLELLGKLPLDGRRAVYLVRVTNTTYVVGASEAGLVKLGEHHDATFPTGEPPELAENRAQKAENQ